MSGSAYTGAWNDWTKSFARRGTITLEPAAGNILIAFVALFIAAVSNSAWSLACYFLHQIRSSENPRNGLHHQIQALLRNSQSPWSFAQKGALCCWAWRARVGIGSSLNLSIFSTLFAIAFAFVSIFSSNIANTEGNVLATGKNCGFISPTYQLVSSTSGNISETIAVDAELRSDLVQSQAYAYTCYANKTLFLTSSTSCSVFIQRRLHWKGEHLKGCPFGGGICSQSFSMDTGMINSALHLGVNQPAHDQVSYRRVTTCSPLNAKNFVKINAVSSPPTLTMNYGSANGESSTFQAPLPELQNQATAYRLSTFLSHPTIGGNTFQPIAPLRKSNALTTLFLLANAASYAVTGGSGSIADPWFNGSWYPGNGHTGSFAVGALACTEQTQYCKRSSCTPLSDNALFRSKDFDRIGLNIRQRTTALRIQKAANLTTLGNAPVILSQNVLAALSELLGPGSTQSLPFDSSQWITEVSHFHDISMAGLQKEMTKYVDGPSNPVVLPRVQRPDTEEEQQQCQNQIVYSQSYTSFNALAIGIIFGIGGLTILLDTFLPAILSFYQQKGRLGSHRLHAWKADHILQLQRALYERLHFSRWIRVEKEVPVTVDGGKFVRPGADFLSGSALEFAIPKVLESDMPDGQVRRPSDKLLRVL